MNYELTPDLEFHRTASYAADDGPNGSIKIKFFFFNILNLPLMGNDQNKAHELV